MKYIHPHQRFSKNRKIARVEPDQIEIAMNSLGVAGPPEALSGGFMNANFKVMQNNAPRLLRIYSTDMVTAQREHDLLTFLLEKGIDSPHSLQLVDHESFPVALHEFVEGVTLQEWLLANPDSVNTDIFHEIGAALAKIQSITFTDGGFLGPGLSPGKEYERFAPFAKDFVLATLKNAPEERLSKDHNNRLQRLVETEWHRLEATEPKTQLCHCDFNPKNIMVTDESATRLAAIIDWEFCISGNGLIDMGNFFRFAYDYPEGATLAFEKGYRSVKDDLTEDWLELGMLFDLANMAGFLERKEDYPETFATARAIIANTLDLFGY